MIGFFSRRRSSFSHESVQMVMLCGYHCRVVRVPRLRRMRLAVMPDGIVHIRANARSDISVLRDFVTSHHAWISSHMARYDGFVSLSEEDIQALWRDARILLPQRVAELAGSLGFRYSRVTLRHQKTRWGSCSHADAISLNIELMRLPTLLRDYVIVHELVHTIHRHHQSSFWEHLERVFPGAESYDRMLRSWKIGYRTRS